LDQDPHPPTEEFIVVGYLAASPNRFSSLILAQ
jgi:hypothetical protein